jgi:D-psicose/D-tagatose/L-ribulose 3-epimerase
VSRYRYPLCMQLTLPADYRRDAGFGARLQALQAAGFSGVELNIVDPEKVQAADLTAFVADHGLAFVAFATGATARAHGLSLSDPDPARRLRSIDRALAFIEFGARAGADVIVGYLQGPPGEDPARLRPLFRESLAALEGAVAAARVRFVVEAVTRFYSPVANTLDQAWDFIRPFGNPWLRIMPDTFNMNIEERDGRRALREHLGRYDAVHLSDNNRLFPGQGAIDFALLIAFLGEIGFAGRLGIEGEIARSFDEDLETCVRVLAPVLRS